MMKLHKFGRYAALFVLTLVSVDQSAADSPHARAQAADKDWQALERLSQPLEFSAGQMDRIRGDGMLGAMHEQYTESMNRLYRELGMEFYRKHPADPRRWEWFYNTRYRGVLYYKSLDVQSIPLYAKERDSGAGYFGSQSLQLDQAAGRQWMADMLQISLECLRAPDCTAKQCEEAVRSVGMLASQARRARNAGADWAPDMSVARELLAVAGARFPDPDASRLMRSVSVSLFVYLKQYDPALCEGLLADLKSSPNPGLREVAAGLDARLRIEHTPMTLLATAIDGRAVDMEKLRGKVVLLEFWSTGCIPCVEEIPNIKDVYARYRAQGFEVIGVSQDSGPGGLGRLQAFVSKNGMSWPQLHDPENAGVRGSLAARYSVTAIPAPFLFGRDGKLVATDARGPKLEQLVRQHLGLEPRQAAD